MIFTIDYNYNNGTYHSELLGGECCRYFVNYDILDDGIVYVGF